MLSDEATSPEVFAKIVRSRRSTRSFDPGREVPEEVVDELLDLARWAPSGGNAQPWEFLVVRDDEMRSRIVDLYRGLRESASSARSLIGAVRAGRGRRSRS